MLNGKYELIATTIDHEEIGSYIGYGIRYGEHAVTDISLDRAKIENLIERMNSNELSPLHMMDISEGYLDGLEVVCCDYRELTDKYRDSPDVSF